jgi:hypothetical protein
MKNNADRRTAMNKFGLALVVGVWPLGAGAHPGHDGVPIADENGIGHSLAHYLLSSEHGLVVVAGLVAIGIAARPLRRVLRACRVPGKS